MKTILVLACCLVFCAAGCSAPAGSAVRSSVQTDAGRTETSTEAAKSSTAGKIQITPPEGWKSVAGSPLEVQYLKGTASFMVKPERFSGASLDEVVTEAEEIYRKSFHDYTAAGEPGQITVDGKEARKLTFTCTIGKIAMKFMYVYLFAGNQTYVITFGDQESTFGAIEPDIDIILKNIRFAG